MTVERKMFNKLIGDQAYLPDFLIYFEMEGDVARDELVMHGSIESLSTKLPVIVEKRFTQMQYLNAAMKHFEDELSHIRGRLFKQYKENYPRDLSSSDIVKYIDGEPDIVAMNGILLQIGSLRAEFESICKGLNSKSYQINNITNLRTAGLDDARIE